MKQFVPYSIDPQMIPPYPAENTPSYAYMQRMYQNNINNSQVQPNNYFKQIGVNNNPPIISNYPNNQGTNIVQNCNKEITFSTPIYNQMQLSNVPIQPQLNQQLNQEFIPQPRQLIQQTQQPLVQVQQVKSFPIIYNRQQQQQQQPFYPSPNTQLNYNKNTWDVNINDGRNLIPTSYTNTNNIESNLIDSNFNSKPMVRLGSGNSIVNYIDIPNHDISYQYPSASLISNVNNNNNNNNNNINNNNNNNYNINNNDSNTINNNEHKTTVPRMVFGSPIWTADEDDLLLKLKDVENLNWRDISLYFPSRTINACQFRWRRLVIKKQNKIKREARRALKAQNLKKNKKANIKKGDKTTNNNNNNNNNNYDGSDDQNEKIEQDKEEIS